VYLKDNVHKNNPQAVDELKEEMSSVIRITADTVCRVVANFQCFLQIVLDASGLHIELVFH
jgi:hypothetical protein